MCNYHHDHHRNHCNRHDLDQDHLYGVEVELLPNHRDQPLLLSFPHLHEDDHSNDDNDIDQNDDTEMSDYCRTSEPSLFKQSVEQLIIRTGEIDAQ